jgi:hypothetical protein
MAERKKPAGVKDSPSAARFRTLPEHIPLDQMISTQEVDPAPDPTMGRDTELEFLLRNAGPV